MAIIYPLTMPSSPSFQRLELIGRNVTAISASPFSGQQQVYLWPGEWWEAAVDLPPMARAAAEEWIAFLVSLRGLSGTFLLGDPSGKTARGSVPGTPQVDGASQTGISLNTKGWTASQANILRKGDYIQLGTGATTRLYKVLTDVSSDGLGKATLDIFPRLRESPADSATVVVSSCKGTFRLVESVSRWLIDEAIHFGIGFKALEAF